MTHPLPVANADLFDQMARWICNIPHSKTLNIEFVQAQKGRVVLRLPYQDQLVGDKRTGILHGGVITALVDTTSALSIFSVLEQPEGTPTLDLRIDYCRPATPQLPVYCVAECYRLARQIAFTRATAYQEGNPQPVATGMATFMRLNSMKGDRA